LGENVVPKRFGVFISTSIIATYIFEVLKTSQALALYLLLVTVADSQGLSFYSDKTATRLLCISEAELRQARLGLLQAGLIAYEAPLYQVLSLEPTLSTEQPTPRTGQALPISAILRQMLESGGPQQP
jgi:hypothetical protein